MSAVAVQDHGASTEPAGARLRVMFLVRSLGVGGAERQLVTLATGLAGRGHTVHITTCYEPGPLATGLERHGVTLSSLGQASALALAGPLARLRDEVRRWQPDILHGYMPTSNLLTALAKSSGAARIAWGVRASNIEWAGYGLMARASFGLSRLVARRADLIIANSEAGRRFHIAEGYPADRMIVIPNGIDVRRFRPDAEARASTRAAWGVAPDRVVIGMVARLDPMKDHGTLLKAFAAREASLADALLVCAGDGSADRKAELASLADALGIGGQVRWLEATGPVERLYPGFDLHTSASSFGEGFSNAVAEAMACGVPCVATDAGDAALLVGATGELVPVRNPEALAAGWQRLLLSDHRARGLLARERIVAEFSAERLVLRSESAFRALAHGARTST